MTDSVIKTELKLNTECEPQCQYYVMRKKRLCRMTVRPGLRYCGEHDPQPLAQSGQKDTRIPCPLDPKHTCYASKLKKHLAICNARQQEEPPYIVHNINAPAEVESCVRRPLSEYSRELVMQVIDKVNLLYDKYIKDHITTLPEPEIHKTVCEEYNEPDRAESSRRHLRQTSRLLHIAEDEQLVADGTCYVELGAGKGQLSYYACRAWCSNTSSRVLLVDRSSLRHKRDNRAGCEAAARLRADLAHLALHLAPPVPLCAAVVGIAKHLCGVATDYALRCITAAGVVGMTRGLVLATCCHHRCVRSGYVANHLLEELGINGEDMNVMLGIVSWATCGDGLSRERRLKTEDTTNAMHDTTNTLQDTTNALQDTTNTMQDTTNTMQDTTNTLQDTTTTMQDTIDRMQDSTDTMQDTIDRMQDTTETMQDTIDSMQDSTDTMQDTIDRMQDTTDTMQDTIDRIQDTTVKAQDTMPHFNALQVMSRQDRAEVGRRAKALLDWGRVLYLRQCGFDARLCHYVPTSVSLENVCIVARRKCSS